MDSMKSDKASKSRMHPPKEAHIPKEDTIGEQHKLSHTSLLVPAKSEQGRISNSKRRLSTLPVMPKLHSRPITNIEQNMAREGGPTLTDIFP